MILEIKIIIQDTEISWESIEIKISEIQNIERENNEKETRRGCNKSASVQELNVRIWVTTG